jgi:putative redox protein
VEVRLTHGHRHRDDCADPDAPSSKIEVISRRVELSGDLTHDQIERMHSIADRCPVHRTLTTDLRIETELTTG